MNKLARSVNKWTGACDRRTAILTSYIHHTSGYRQYCHVCNTAQHCRLGLFQDSDFAGDFEDSKATTERRRVGSYVSLEVEHLSPLVGCASNKRHYSGVLHNQNHFVGCSTANGWITCSWFMGCGDRSVTFIEQYQNTNQPPQQVTVREMRIPNPNKRETEMLKNDFRMWTASPQTKNSSQGESQLYTFEDIEAVIKMIIKGRSPTMSVSRTHRVALDWLFDRINLEPKIQIKYVDTKNQLADILTKGSFTRDEWDHLLRLLDVLYFSMVSCSHFLSNRKQSVMSKRAQESISKEGLAVAKPRPMNWVSRNLLTAKKDPPQDSSDPNSLGNQELDQSCVFIQRQETDAKHPPKPNNVFSREAIIWHSIFQHQETGAERWTFKLSPCQETGARWRQPNRKVKDWSPQCANLQLSIPRKSLQELAETV